MYIRVFIEIQNLVSLCDCTHTVSFFYADPELSSRKQYALMCPYLCLWIYPLTATLYSSLQMDSLGTCGVNNSLH